MKFIFFLFLPLWILAEPLSVLCTTEIVASLVKEVAGDRAVVDVLIVGMNDPHTYQIVKGDGERLLKSKIIFSSGLGLEHGLYGLGPFRSHPHLVALGDSLPKDRLILQNGQTDPHYWMDLSLAAFLPEVIAKAMGALDEKGSAFYLKRALDLKKKLLKLDGEIFAKMQLIPSERRFLLTSHDAFNYFARRYLATPKEVKSGSWRERFEAPEGLAPESQIPLAQMKRILDYIDRYKIKVAFPESNLSKDSLLKVVEVAKSRGLKIELWKEPLYGDTLGPKASAAATYEGMMKYNAQVMSEGWK